jgi:tRNA(fMet)-specific endonuclease VapC
MRYLLDTNIVSDLVCNPQGKVAERIANVGEESVCTRVIVAALAERARDGGHWS